MENSLAFLSFDQLIYVDQQDERKSDYSHYPQCERGDIGVYDDWWFSRARIAVDGSSVGQTVRHIVIFIR